MTGAVATTPFIARRERFTSIGSTNDVVRAWLDDGTPEVCLAVADEQTAGRGRSGRTWTAPAGAGLLLSVGFRPAWLAPDHTWRLAAIVALAMAEAAEREVRLPARSIRLKWPNDLVVETRDGTVRKLAGLLGETVGLGGDEPRAIVGLGLNADWPAADFPADLAATMTSLREAAGRSVDVDGVLAAFEEQLEQRTLALRDGRFDVAGWVARQLTNGRLVRLETADGATAVVRALGVDASTGGLIVGDAAEVDGRRTVLSGEIVHLRLSDAADATQSGV